MKNRFTLMLALLFSSFAQTAHAFLDSPYITPEHPIAGEPVSVNIYGGECDALVGGYGYPRVTQAENVIRILLLSGHFDDPELCFWTIGTNTFAVVSYAPGSYTLQVDRWYFDGGRNPIVRNTGHRSLHSCRCSSLHSRARTPSAGSVALDLGDH